MRRTGIVSLYPLPLVRVQEYGPFFPGEIKSTLQLFHVLHDAKSPLGIRMVEGVHSLRRWNEDFLHRLANPYKLCCARFRMVSSLRRSAQLYALSW